MLLALDMGNTNILAGVFEGERPVCTARAQTAHWRTADEWAVLLRNLLSLRGLEPERLTGAIVSSVAWPATGALCDGIRLSAGIDPLVIGPGVKTGLDIVIDNPAQLGSDMVCNAVAALSQCKPPLIIFDMGTATTMSVIDARGRFIGAAIMPGLNTSLEALSAKAAQLHKISIESPERVVGRNTVESMRSGAVYGTAAMLDGMTDRAEEELGVPCAVLATGGLSERIVPHMRRRARHEPTLILEGLRLIYRKNTDV